MKSKSICGILFLLVAILHLAVPLYMIHAQERILTKGESFKFRTIPVDPYDPFRGRYVALRSDDAISLADESHTTQWARGSYMYVSVATDEDGFAQLVSPSKTPPTSGAYLKVKIRSAYSGQIHIDSPFSRYYMDEKMAPEAERLVRQRLQDDSPVEIHVRILNGIGRIERLYFNGIPIEDYIRENARVRNNPA